MEDDNHSEGDGTMASLHYRAVLSETDQSDNLQTRVAVNAEVDPQMRAVVVDHRTTPDLAPNL